MSAIRLCYPTGFIARPQPPSTFDRMFSNPKPTVRFGDQVPSIPKIAAQDTTLTVSNADGGKTTVPVPSGTKIDIHVPGLHCNRTFEWLYIVGWGQILMKSRSAILEGASQVHARTVP